MPCSLDHGPDWGYLRGRQKVDGARIQLTCFPSKQYDGIQHGCVILGKDHEEYLARDPLRDDKEPVPLSALTENIYAVRVLKKVE